MRLFVAIPMGGEVEQVLSKLLERCSQKPWPVKWVRSEGLHLTVKFLGPVGPERLEAVSGAVKEASRGTPRLSFGLTELGAFPRWSRPRVLWAGLESEAALELLVHRVEQACAGLGFPVEGRPFRPHVTLGRVREDGRIPANELKALEREKLPAINFVADRLVLFESISGPGGARYEARAEYPLGN